MTTDSILDTLRANGFYPGNCIICGSYCATEMVTCKRRSCRARAARRIDAMRDDSYQTLDTIFGD